MKAKFIVKQEDGMDFETGCPRYTVIKTFKHKPEAIEYVKKRDFVKMKLEKIEGESVTVYNELIGDFV